jgi:hypothetical protein
MEHKFHEILSSVDELVDTLRDQGLTCRDIAALLG